MAETSGMRFALASLLAVLALAACGGGSRSTAGTASTGRGAGSSSTTTTHAGTAGHPTTAPPVTKATTGGAPNGSTGAGGNLCRASDLALSFLGGQGATGHDVLGFELRNVTSQSCHTFGFPGVQFVDGAGRPLPTLSTRTTRDFFGSAPETALTVAPGESVSFRIGVTQGVVSSAGCTTAAAVSVIPPNDTGSLRVTIPHGAYECRTATVTPVRPGASAYP